MPKYIGKSPEVKGEGRSIVLYGPPFVGKTTLLSDPDVKILLGDMDHNTTPLDNADNVTIYPIDSFDDYLKFKESVQRGYFLVDKEKIPLEDYDVIAFDSFTRYEELIKRYVVTTFAPSRRREIADKFGAQSDWDDLQTIEVREVRDWQAMTRSMGFNVMWIGHDMAVRDDPNVESRVTRIQLALQGKYASPRIMSAVDAVLYMDKRSVPSKEDPKKMEIIRGVYTQQFGVTQADVRLPVEKRQQLPIFVPEPKLSKLLPFLGYKKKQAQN